MSDLLVSLQHIEDVLTNQNIALFVLDSSSTVTNVNSIGSNLLSSEVNPIGKKVNEIFTIDRTTLHKISNLRLLNKGPFNFEGRIEKAIYSLSLFPNQSDVSNGPNFIMVANKLEGEGRSQVSIDKRYLAEKTVASISKNLLEKGNLYECLKVLGEFVGVNRTYIFYIRSDKKNIYNAFEWCDENTEPQIQNLQDLPVSLFPWWMEKIFNSENIVIPDVKEMPMAAKAEKKSLLEQNIKSLLVVPIGSKKKILGFLGFDDTKTAREWDEFEINFLKMIAEMISSFESGRRSEQEYQKLSKMYHTLTEAANDMIFVIDKDDKVSYVNKYAANKLRGKPGEILGKKREDLFPGDKNQFKFLSKVFSSGKPVYSERKMSFPKGEIWLGTSLVPVKEENGEINSVLGVARDITKRKLHEELLVKSEENFRNFFHQAPISIIVVEDGKFVECNPATCSLFDLKEADIVGHYPWEIRPTIQLDGSTAKESTLRIFNEFDKDESKIDFVFSHKRDDGQDFYVAVHLAKYETDERTRILAFAYDITERISFERQLIESEQRYRDTVERWFDPYYAWDTEGRITRMNAAAEQLSQVRFDDVVGKPIIDILTDDNQGTFKNNFSKLMGGTNIQGLEMVRTNEDGSMAWVSISGRRVIKDGIVQGGEAFVKVITEQKNAEEKLKKSQARYESLFQSIPYEVFAVDPNGVIQETNTAFKKMWGKKRQGIEIGNIFKSENVKTIFLDNIAEVFSEKKPSTFAFSFKRNKSWYYYKSILNPILLENGELIGVVGINIDTTELSEALQNAQRFSGRLVYIQEEERQRISREIHDSLGGYLASIQLEIANAKNAVSKNDPVLAESILQASKETVKQVIKTTHELTHDLRPHLLDDFGISATIRDYIQKFSTRSEIAVNFEQKGEDKGLRMSIQLALFRLLQESLTNIQRHAGAQNAELGLEILDNVVRFVIKDDGKGFEKNPLQLKGTKHFGLKNMKDRIDLLGGELTIESSSNEGTIISAEIPITQGQQNEN